MFYFLQAVVKASVTIHYAFGVDDLVLIVGDEGFGDNACVTGVASCPPGGGSSASMTHVTGSC